jgi:membrane-associated phospholipid phosphatase
MKTSPASSVLILALLACLPRVCANTVYPLRDLALTTRNIVLIDKGDVPWLVGAAAASAALFLYDREITGFVRQNRGTTGDAVFRVARYGGDGWFVFGVSGAALLSGLLADNNHLKSLGVYMLEGFCLSGLYVQVVKVAVGRERPYVSNDPYMFRPFSFRDSGMSFYSGHSTEVFTMASVISHYFRKPWVSCLAYGLAGLVGVQRIYARKHWSSDVFVGAFTGVLIGRSVVRFNEDFLGVRAGPGGFSVSFRIKKSRAETGSPAGDGR